jgi:soluble lytic murein transglycosylase-like protein
VLAALVAGLAPCGSGLAATPPAASPDWMARRAEWTRVKREYEAVRWSGALADILPVLARRAAAESTYLDALERWSAAGEHPAPARAARASYRAAALDLVERNRLDAALRLLDGPLRSDPLTLPVRARVTGLRASSDSGLAVLGWPPDRRVPGARPMRFERLGASGSEEDEAAYVVAASLSDSAGLPRAERAALWRLVESPRATTRSYGRVLLVQSLLASGEPRLVAALLEQAKDIDDDERLLLANLRADFAASLGDTLWAVQWLVGAAGNTRLGTAERYAAATRAASWLRGARTDSLSETSWLVLVKTLGDVGEAETGLAVLHQRRVAATDSAAGLARAEMEAALLAKMRRYTDAASAYAALLARGGLPAATRADYALNLARAYRGADDFPGADTTFALATSLDPGSPTAGQAAWERAREWEDRKPARATADVYAWAVPRISERRLEDAARVHWCISWMRAGNLDSASVALRGSNESTRAFWQATIATARGDSAGALAAYRRVSPGDPWTYQGARAREVIQDAGIALEPVAGAAGSASVIASPAARAGTAGDADPPLALRLLGAAGAAPLMTSSLRDCARRAQETEARECTEALEDLGIFRVGPRAGVPWPRLEYPPAYADIVAGAADRESLSAALIWSIMRQESGYSAPVRSRAGAIGLLQLLPSTASKLNRAPVTDAALTDPALNVRLGARYIRDLTREFGDPRAVMAAYNAGEDAVRRWLKDRPKVDDVWVEMIPYRETRDYVKQVYSVWRRYEAIYAAPSAGKG